MSQHSNKTRPSKKRIAVYAIVGVVLMSLGYGMAIDENAQNADVAAESGGFAYTEPTQPAETPEPKVIHDTETVEVTPQACLDALDATERLVHHGVIPGFDAAADALLAASQFDPAGIDAATADLTALTPKVQDMVADYNASADLCRSANA